MKELSLTLYLRENPSFLYLQVKTIKPVVLIPRRQCSMNLWSFQISEKKWKNHRMMEECFRHMQKLYIYIPKQQKYRSLTDRLQLFQHFCFHYPLRKRFHHYQVFFLRQLRIIEKYQNWHCGCLQFLEVVPWSDAFETYILCSVVNCV